MLAGSAFAALSASVPARTQEVPLVVQGVAPMSQIARGTFEVDLKPLAVEDAAEDSSLGRMSIDKTISGDLIATTQGQMLSAMTDTKGSAGYVAMERVTGTLHGRKGSFVLQHSATMNRGEPSLNISVVPDSGDGELKGLTGEFKIDIVDGKHFYEFTYHLDEDQAGSGAG